MTRSEAINAIAANPSRLGDGDLATLVEIPTSWLQFGQDVRLTKAEWAAATSRDDVLARLRDNAPSIRKLGAQSLYLFGSAARDEMSADSDVDVFIDYQQGGSFTFVEWSRLEELIRQLTGRNVDVLTRARLHPLLKDSIERSSIEVLCDDLALRVERPLAEGDPIDDRGGRGHGRQGRSVGPATQVGPSPANPSPT